MDELLQELCPNGVEYKKLSEITVKITDGMHNFPKSIVPDGVYPIISAQNIYDGKIDINTQKYVNEETFEAENKRTQLAVS